MGGRGADATPRSAVWAPHNEAAAAGRLLLQVCADCGRLSYPPAEVCRDCLSDRLDWQAVAPRGRLLAWTRLHASLEERFRAALPLRLGSVELEAGPVAIAWLAGAPLESGDDVTLLARLDTAGRAVLVAVAAAAAESAAGLDFATLMSETPG